MDNDNHYAPEYQNIQTGPDVPPRYAHYQMHQGTPGQDNRSRETHKKNRTGKKFAVTVALAVVFGLVAGVVFQCVNIIGNKYFGTEEQEQTPIASTELVADTTQAAAADTSATSDSASDAAKQTGSVASVASAAMPAVVAITSVSIQEIPNVFSMFGYGGTQQYSSEGSGSGIIVGENDDELLIATNNHVVEDATTLSVCFIGEDVADAEEETEEAAVSDSDVNVENAVSAKIKGTDEDNDLAVVAVNKSDIPEDILSQIKIAQLGDSDSLQVGEQVVAIGNALGYGQSVTSGWVSALNRTVTTDNTTSSGLIQTDAAINPGNSGGALLNMSGEVIGINSAKYADSAVEGMGYAIPISKAKPILEELMNRQTRDKVDASSRGYLGIVPADLSAEVIEMYNMPEGVFVRGVTESGGAAAAGIQKGDIIVKLDGQTVKSESSLQSQMEYYAAGETIDVIVARMAENGEYVEQTFSVTLGNYSSIGE